MSGDSDVEKEHAPSERRLAEARARGEIARSVDLVTAGTYGGFLLAMLVAGPGALQAMGAAGALFLGEADRLADSGRAALAGAMLAFALAAMPLFALPAAGALAALMAQRAIVFAPEKLAPRVSRISPLAILTQKFGPAGLFEFAKSTAKMLAVGALLFGLLSARTDAVMGTQAMTAAMGMAALLRLLVEFVALVFALTLVLGAVDYGWQVFQHLKGHRMSRQEVMDEQKSSEGDPHVKGQRRQRGQEIAMNRMLLDVAKADVVIVNPTHYAVALRWERGRGRAPVCVAKGVDEIAARIRERAAAAGVAIHRDPATARLLHATVDLGQEIRPDHYQAVATAIRFAEALRRRARR